MVIMSIPLVEAAVDEEVEVDQEADRERDRVVDREGVREDRHTDILVALDSQRLVPYLHLLISPMSTRTLNTTSSKKRKIR